MTQVVRNLQLAISEECNYSISNYLMWLYSHRMLRAWPRSLARGICVMIYTMSSCNHSTCVSKPDITVFPTIYIIVFACMSELRVVPVKKSKDMNHYRHGLQLFLLHFNTQVLPRRCTCTQATGSYPASDKQYNFFLVLLM